ncbi:uncharacterized protein LOC106177619 [Lingula anatina]|uniref:Uncharacterized protein LOC106177619 n=1 Tax=Lingula anatina TaxID=7574 RepID=A0A1S3K0V2_LINAN|nr:uncharacterized protein LOC106177619 [Lingula anatina]|eukprot:XP_013415911.1 uncharacterized protein LOC106177619 [Lingula anatina]
MDVRISFVFILNTLLGAQGLQSSVKDATCCVPTQFEAKVYMDAELVFLDTTSSVSRPLTAYSMFNYTVHLAYDYDRQQLYMHANVTETSPLIPHPVTDSVLYLFDHKHGVMYTVNGGHDGKCQKDNSTVPMSQQCIPDDALLQRNSAIGNPSLQPLAAKVYQYEVKGDPDAFPFYIQAFVKQNGKQCLPMKLHVVTAGGSGTMNAWVMNFVNLTQGIQDPSIFSVPGPCRGATQVTKITTAQEPKWKQALEVLLGTIN